MEPFGSDPTLPANGLTCAIGPAAGLVLAWRITYVFLASTFTVHRVVAILVSPQLFLTYTIRRLARRSIGIIQQVRVRFGEHSQGRISISTTRFVVQSRRLLFSGSMIAGLALRGTPVSAQTHW